MNDDLEWSTGVVGITRSAVELGAFVSSVSDFSLSNKISSAGTSVGSLARGVSSIYWRPFQSLEKSALFAMD